MHNSSLDFSSLPNFKSINAEKIESSLKQLLDDNRRDIAALVEQKIPTWNNLILPLQNIDDRLTKMWSPINHLTSVMNSPELREAHEQGLALLTEYSSEIGHNKKLYQAYCYIKEHEYKTLNSAQQKVVDNALRDFKLSGIALSEADKKRFVELEKRYAELSTQFSNNLLDATQAWFLHVTDEADLSGLTDLAKQLAKQAAEQKKLTGWVFTLDQPAYHAIMTYANKRELREKMYRAYVTRASEHTSGKNHLDNSSVMVEMLQVRNELAQLLDFNNYAERSLATKMANHPQDVLDFLKKLAEKAKVRAQKEYAELCEFAQQKELAAWDIAYYSEKLKHEKYEVDQELFRPYFPLEKVLSGMFEIMHKLYNVSAKPSKAMPTWHEDVRCFEIYNAHQELIGCLYMDFYARENKQGGAWMDEAQSRYLRNGKIQLPIAYLTCNFGPPANGQASLLTHDEVITLFHEFGHCLHQLLTEVEYLDLSGTNGVEWDAVELPSQFFENFCWEYETLPLISAHIKTGQPLPASEIDKLKAAKTFQSGLLLVKQISFSLFDFELHMQNPTPDNAGIQNTLNTIRNQLSPFTTPDYNRFQHSFSHIFGGGYAAGYYSYLWAEVLSCDVFAKFIKEGVVNPEVGQDFLKKILSQGGSRDMMSLFKDFYGREPSIDALLRDYGLV